MGKTTPPVFRLPSGTLAPSVPPKKAGMGLPDAGGGFWRAIFGLAIFDPFNWRGDRCGQDGRDE